MDPDPHVSSENALLAERSFLSEADKTSITNGYHPEWADKLLSSQGYCSGVGNIGHATE